MLKIFALLYFIPAMVKIQGEECDFHKMIGGAGDVVLAQMRLPEIDRTMLMGGFGRLWEYWEALGVEMLGVALFAISQAALPQQPAKGAPPVI